MQQMRAIFRPRLIPCGSGLTSVSGYRSVEEMWDFVAIENTAQSDSTLILRIMVFNPDRMNPYKSPPFVPVPKI
jgi:hypothetical protein